MPLCGPGLRIDGRLPPPLLLLLFPLDQALDPPLLLVRDLARLVPQVGVTLVSLAVEYEVSFQVDLVQGNLDQGERGQADVGDVLCPACIVPGADSSVNTRNGRKASAREAGL